MFINSITVLFSMVMDIIMYSLALAALLAGSINDIRTREVPDWLSYGLLGSALGLRVLFSVVHADWIILIEGLAGFALFFVFGCIFYYSGQWGGGDSKLLMGIGMLLGFDSSFQHIPQVVIFFIFSLFAGAAYGLAWVVVLFIRRFSRVRREFARQYKPLRLYGIFSLLLSSALLLFSFSVPYSLLPFSITVAFLPFTTFYLWLFVRSVEKVAFYKRISPYDLTEGDWIANPIIVGGEQVVPSHGIGVTKRQIQKLHHLYDFGKISTVVIKQGIPFVPSFLLGLLLMIFFNF